MLDLKKKNNCYEWIFLSKKTCSTDKEKIDLLVKNFILCIENSKSYSELIYFKESFDFYYNYYYLNGLISDEEDFKYMNNINGALIIWKNKRSSSFKIEEKINFTFLLILEILFILLLFLFIF